MKLPLQSHKSKIWGSTENIYEKTSRFPVKWPDTRTSWQKREKRSKTCRWNLWNLSMHDQERWNAGYAVLRISPRRSLWAERNSTSRNGSALMDADLPTRNNCGNPTFVILTYNRTLGILYPNGFYGIPHERFLKFTMPFHRFRLKSYLQKSATNTTPYSSD